MAQEIEAHVLGHPKGGAPEGHSGQLGACEPGEGGVGGEGWEGWGSIPGRAGGRLLGGGARRCVDCRRPRCPTLKPAADSRTHGPPPTTFLPLWPPPPPPPRPAGPYSHRVLLTLEEAGTPYSINFVNPENKPAW